MMSPRRPGVPLVAVLSALVLVLAGCGDASTERSSREQQVLSTDRDVSFKDCKDKCQGETDGAKYSIVLPDKWNGTLLLYSHGYRFAAPAPPDFEEPETSAQVSSTDTDGMGTDALSRQLLAQGYALAGSSYKSNGWAVADGVNADQALYKTFSDVVGKPDRTYVWGDSLGGLITTLVAERNPDWVDGAAPMCGAVAGPNLNLDLALDVGVAIKALIDPDLKLTGFTSSDEANAEWRRASALVQKAAADVSGGGTAKVLYIGALTNVAARTKTYDGATAESKVKATVEALLTALAYGTAGRYEIEKRVNGNASTNEGTDYASRISKPEAELIETAGGDVDALSEKLDAVPRVQADSGARERFKALGDPTGRLPVPTLTMHTEADPLVIVQNETVLAQRVQKQSRGSNLVQLYVAAPDEYSESTGAPYGAGHCNFSDAQRVGLVQTLDKWVRGVYPVPSGVTSEFGKGMDPAFTAGPWPASEAG